MVIGIPVLLGLAAAALLGANWAGLAAVRWRLAPLCLLGFALQYVLFAPVQPFADLLAPYGPYVYVFSHLLVLGALAANVGLPGLRLILLGSALNLAAILANGGQMPTLRPRPDLPFPNTVPRSADTRLAILSDWLRLPPFPTFWFSVGDVFIGAGGAVAAFRLARQPLPGAPDPGPQPAPPPGRTRSGRPTPHAPETTPVARP